MARQGVARAVSCSVADAVVAVVAGFVAALAVVVGAVGVLAVLAVSSTRAYAAGSAQFRPVPLPPDVGYLNAIACPNAQECFIAGQTAGSNQRGLVLHLVAGVWHSTVIPSAAYLTGISCVDATQCSAVGVASDSTRAGAGVVVDTVDGSSWQSPPQPSAVAAAGSPAVPLDSVSCAGTFCMAVGGELPAAGGAPASQVWVKSAGRWSTATPPTGPGSAGVYLVAVDCTARADCWVVGQGVWHSSDGGASWVLHNPPNSGAAFSAVWSLLPALIFTDPLHGLVAGGDQCGGATEHCPGFVFRTADGGTTWARASNDATPFVEAVTCRSGLTACIATSGTFTPILPGGATSNLNDGSVVLTSGTGSNWPITQRLRPDNLTAVACPTSTNCLAVGGDQPHNIGAVLTEQPLPAAPANLSVVATSIPSPGDAFGGVGRAVLNTSITLAAMLALTFPSQLFNRTFDENYDEILAITRRGFGRLGPRRAPEEAGPSVRRSVVVFVAVVAAGSLIGSLRDPGFGANARSVLAFVATAVALLVAVAAGYLAARIYRARVHAGIAAQLRALPAGLVVAALCVAVSRVAHFQPGYLYGVVCGAVFAGSLKRRELGQLTLVSSLAMLVVSVAAWFAWVPVNHAATQHGAFVGVVLFDDVLASIFVAGLTGTVISLLPLRFMPGQALYSWHRGVWAATFGIATFGLVEVLLRPSTQAATHPGNIAWATAAALFAIFGIGSLAFREYFARRVPADQQRVGLGAAAIMALRAGGGRSEHELAQLLTVEVGHLHATVDRLERGGWLHRARLPHALDADAPLDLSAAASALYESRHIGRFTRQRLILALTRADRTAVADVLKPPVSPAGRVGSDVPPARSDRSPTPDP